MDLGRLGVWSGDIRKVDATALDAAAEVEELGYGTIWFPAGSGTRGFDIAAALLAATSRITVATGITSIWATTADESNAAHATLEREHPGRFLLGVGASHESMVNQGSPGRYQRPLASTAQYLDELTGVPVGRRIVAALGPKMLGLARSQSLGSHLYLVTPTITADVRAALGAGRIVAVEQGVVLATDPDDARRVGREHLSLYLRLPNYVNNWLRAGYTPDDVAGAGSDRLVDDLIAWGTAEQVGERIREQFAAGADHVCLQVLGGGQPVPIEQWRVMAATLL
jgi:probable F420-dependent oxidoreductase